MRPDRLAGLPRAPVGVAAVLAVLLAAPALTGAGLLVPAGAPGGTASAALRGTGLAVAAAAVVALARRSDVGRRRVPAIVLTAGAVAGTLGLLTLPTSEVTLDWPPPPATDPLPPTAALPPPVGGGAAPPPPVLRLPAGGRLDVHADELILEFPDGSTYPFGSAAGGDGATPLPALPSLELEVDPDGGLLLTDGSGTPLIDVPAGGRLDVGDVRVEGEGGNGLVDVLGGAVTDAGGVASGEVDVMPDAPSRAGRDGLATVAGVLLAGAAYWLVFVHGRITPQRRAALAATDPPETVSSAARPADRRAAGEGLVATLDRLLADPDPRTAVVAAYARLLAALDGAGLGRLPQEAPHEHLRRALQPLGVRPEPVHELADLFVLARFGHRPITEAHRDGAVSALRRAAGDLGVLQPATAGQVVPA